MYLFIIALFFLSLFLTIVIKNIAIKKSLIDIPDDRSSHTIPTPYGGGIAIGISWFVGISYLYIQNLIDPNLYYAFMMGIFICAISFLDDLYMLTPSTRIIVQILVALMALVFLGGLQRIDLIFFYTANQMLTNIFAFLLIVYFINIYNFIDGIDGYAGAQAVFLGLAGYIIWGDLHFLVFASSVAGFLVLNWHKAKIFMGDVGSTLLGYNVAIFVIYYQNSSIQSIKAGVPDNGTSVLIWGVLFGLFWVDATLTLLRRYFNAEELSKPHKKHFYQRLTQSGYSHSKVVSLAMMINIILFGLVYFIDNYLIAFLISSIIFYAIIKFVDNKKAFDKD